MGQQHLRSACNNMCAGQHYRTALPLTRRIAPACVHVLAVVCVAACPQPLYKKLLGFEVFGLGFMTSVVSSSASSNGSSVAQHAREQPALPACCHPVLVRPWCALLSRGVCMQAAVAHTPAQRVQSFRYACTPCSVLCCCSCSSPSQECSSAAGWAGVWAAVQAATSAMATAALAAAAACVCPAQTHLGSPGPCFDPPPAPCRPLPCPCSWTLSLGEFFIKRLPLVKHIYSASKQVSGALNPDSNEGSKAFQECVLARHPRHGEYAIAFITGRTVLQVGGWVAEDCGRCLGLACYDN